MCKKYIEIESKEERQDAYKHKQEMICFFCGEIIDDDGGIHYQDFCTKCKSLGMHEDRELCLDWNLN